MLRFAHMVGVAAIAAIGFSATSVWAVSPNPLENAYWRFEEGSVGSVVNPPNDNVIVDSSGNSNNMRAYMDSDPNNPNPNASPTYSDFLPPKPLASGAPNTLSFQFNPFPNGKDIYTDGRQINNGIIAPGGGFTIEAAFNSNNPATWGTIISKEGRPKLGHADEELSSLSTFSLMTNADDSRLMVQQFDAAGNLVVAQSQQAINPGQWYYTAVVNDGSNLSLWLDSGAGYELQETVAVGGALYQGPDYNNNMSVDAADYVFWRKNNSSDPSSYERWRAAFGKGADWDYAWSIGRGVFGGIDSGTPNNWFNGYIDEVRLSNTALSPSEFLFASQAIGVSSTGIPEPGSMSLVCLTIGAMAFPRRRRRGLLRDDSIISFRFSE